MKYVIEDNINFFDEVKNKKFNNNEKTCLIENKPLISNNITLQCNHTFNYVPLLNEIIKQKTKYNPNEITRLQVFQIKCPYCRQITDKLLPFIPNINESRKINGVTTPKKYWLQHKKCSWKYKSGKNKGICCNGDAFETTSGDFCEKHWNCINKKQDTIKQINSIWTIEMQNLYDSITINEVKTRLKERNISCIGNKKELIVKYIIS
tara:strand:- start:7050 stop:7670 length:621 start_codon:yes stop_codon:yes gene_type:complete